MNDVIRRARCATCLRPASACICGHVHPVRARTAVLVLQHPLEVANAKNSGRLLHLCLPGSALAVGEAFAPARLQALLGAHGPGRRAVLLYPETPGDRSLGIAPAPPYVPAAAEELLLVVLDATWRKSRKMLYLNPALQALPRLALRDLPPSRYAIRKAQAPGQLSTLEAAAHALAQIEHGDEDKAEDNEKDKAAGKRAGGHGQGRFAPLFDAFDGFVRQVAGAQQAGRVAGRMPD